MRILIFSDSHHDMRFCEYTTKNIVGVDLILHAGDHAADAVKLSSLFPHIPIRFVCGNCDFGDYPKEQVVEISGKRIFLTHGHLYNVKNEYTFSSLMSRAKELECDCTVFGHTHTCFCDTNQGITLVNPGSIRYGKTYGVIEIENGKLKAAICDVPYTI